MLKNHISHPHCEAKKAHQNQNSEAGQTSMARDGSVFRYDLDYLREQFTGLVIQRALPFNHFGHEQTMRVFQNTMQPRYTHIFFMSTALSEYELEGAALNPCFNVNGVDYLIESISRDLEFFDDTFASKSKSYFNESLEGFWKEKETMFPVLSRMAMDIISVQASSVASESTFSTSGRVLSIRRTRLTPASLKMCMRLKDHLDAKERKQDKCPLETPLDFEEGVFDDEVQQNEAIPLSDEEIALDASSEGTMSPGGPRYDYMVSSEEAEDEY
ncbi:putative AC transposase [Tanacetum coccineum]